MKIVVEEEGLYHSLDQVSDYLQKALDAKDRKIKDKYISKAYGAVVAINQMVGVVDDGNEADWIAIQ